MSLGAQSELVVLISIVLYLTLPVALLIRGWIIRGGLVMAFARFDTAAVAGVFHGLRRSGIWGAANPYCTATYHHHCGRAYRWHVPRR